MVFASAARPLSLPLDCPFISGHEMSSPLSLLDLLSLRTLLRVCKLHSHCCYLTPRSQVIPDRGQATHTVSTKLHLHEISTLIVFFTSLRTLHLTPSHTEKLPLRPGPPDSQPRGACSSFVDGEYESDTKRPSPTYILYLRLGQVHQTTQRRSTISRERNITSPTDPTSTSSDII